MNNQVKRNKKLIGQLKFIKIPIIIKNIRTILSYILVYCRGNVGVVIFNHGENELKVQPGDRVAQLICEKIEYPELQEMKSLDSTERGEAGFGSTGMNEILKK